MQRLAIPTDGILVTKPDLPGDQLYRKKTQILLIRGGRQCEPDAHWDSMVRGQRLRARRKKSVLNRGEINFLRAEKQSQVREGTSKEKRARVRRVKTRTRGPHREETIGSPGKAGPRGFFSPRSKRSTTPAKNIQMSNRKLLGEKKSSGCEGPKSQPRGVSFCWFGNIISNNGGRTDP